MFSVAARYEMDEMVNGGREGARILSPRSLENSVREVSEDRITDMMEEYAEYRRIFLDLKNYCGIFPTLTKCGIKEENLAMVTGHLIDIGILREYQKKKADPVRYHIPDIYLKGMELRRKGYR